MIINTNHKYLYEIPKNRTRTIKNDVLYLNLTCPFKNKQALTCKHKSTRSSSSSTYVVAQVVQVVIPSSHFFWNFIFGTQRFN